MQEIQRRRGLRIRELRAKPGWSQEEFAAVSGLHRTYVGAVKRGEKNLTISTVHTIARTLNTTIAYLFKGIA
jgi:transcriptional regulator with XRE-family HTH domain